jgi:hypothetical protein
MKATVVTLEPSNNSDDVLTFEQAFGEFSEARGRKKKNRGNVMGRTALALATGGIVGGLIKTGPEARKERQRRRLERIAARKERQEARQGLKDMRKQRRVARKAMGKDEEETSTDETSGSSEDSSESNDSQDVSADTSADTSASEPLDEQATDNSEETSNETLGDNSDSQDEESSFDAETVGQTSSFDNETTMMDRDIAKLKSEIAKFETAVVKINERLRSGKLPSNQVANHARGLKKYVLHLGKLKEMLKRKQAAKKVTPIQKSLNPRINPNKIVIPAKGADGETTSLFDVENEMSSFDGKEFVSKNKGILIGLGATAIIIFALHKMNVFK